MMDLQVGNYINKGTRFVERILMILSSSNFIKLLQLGVDDKYI